jgi:hypothetical protein
LTSNEKYNPKENCSRGFIEEKKMYLASSLFGKNDCYLLPYNIKGVRGTRKRML